MIIRKDNMLSHVHRETSSHLGSKELLPTSECYVQGTRQTHMHARTGSHRHTLTKYTAWTLQQSQKQTLVK